MKGSVVGSDRLSVVVRVDLDGEEIQIAATGHVTMSSLQGLYPVVERTSRLGSGLGIVVDLSRALVEPEALEELDGYARIHDLPVRVEAARADQTVALLPSRSSGSFTLPEVGRAA